MRIIFSANLDHQIKAIEAVTDLFEGQPRNQVAPLFTSVTSSGIAAVSNQLDLDEDTLLANLQAVQQREFVDSQGNALRQPDPGLAKISGSTFTADGEQEISFNNFSVEMETGTGKTYVYIRTALELFQRYGFRKFIIVVPSVAIREGVLKTFEMTKRHFALLFDNAPYRWAAYDSSSLSQVRNFALSDAVEFLVMTLAAFNKADINVIYRSMDQLSGETPIHLIQEARPILILDEPQNMESETSIASLAALNPLFALRYSATHRNLYNLVYRLTPRDAYLQGLVKKIEVASIQTENNVNQPYVALKSVDSNKTKVTAKVTTHRLYSSGVIKESTRTARAGDSLEDLSGGRPIYRRWVIEEINVFGKWIRFTNGTLLRVGDELGADKEDQFRAQILATIEEHFRRQGYLKGIGIKVLSLFFIDRVDNYQGDDALIRRLFDESFNTLKERYPTWKQYSAPEVQAAYFAQKRRRGGETELIDSKSGESKTDQEAYDLIMKDKERLLSFEEPVSFIFSHSALREGWDNPNVFQICTLNQSLSDMRKRQEIGRGVRICVNERGERVYLDGVNTLTVVANEAYEDFVAEYQSELDAAYHEQIRYRFGKPLDKLTPLERALVEKELQITLPPPPANARDRVYPAITAPRTTAAPGRQNQVLADDQVYELPMEFVELWERIKHKTRYNVTVDSERLIEDVVKALEHVRIPRPEVTVTKAAVTMDMVGAFRALQTSAARSLVSLVGRFPLPNVVEIMENLMEQTTPPMRLTRKTLLEIIRRAPDQDALVENPNGFATAVVNVIKDKLKDQLISGIVYEKTGDFWEMQNFEPQLRSYAEHAVPSQKSLYDQVVCDSQVERTFVRDIEALEEVKFYLKLPDWFKIDTPIGGYNPDWAILWEQDGERRVYMVRETKGTSDTTRLQYAHEKPKTDSGRAHFREIGVDYDVVEKASEIRPRPEWVNE